MVADWWGVEMRTGISQVKFVNDLNQRYAYHKVLSEVRKQGFSVAEDETSKTIPSGWWCANGPKT